MVDPGDAPDGRLDAARRAVFADRALLRNPATPNRRRRSLVWGKTLVLLVFDARLVACPRRA